VLAGDVLRVSCCLRWLHTTLWGWMGDWNWQAMEADDVVPMFWFRRLRPPPLQATGESTRFPGVDFCRLGGLWLSMGVGRLGMRLGRKRAGGG
jgi:hypothetical protein